VAFVHISLMSNSRSIVASIVALAVVCALVALEWYSHAGPGKSAPAVRQAVTKAPAASSSPAPPPIVYVPAQHSPAPAPSHQRRSSSAALSSPVASPETSAPPLNAGPTPAPRALPHPIATLPPYAKMPPIVIQRADAPPRILAMSLSTPVARGGDVVSGVVETSSNVASVEARIGGFGAGMQKVGVGRFHLSYRVPNLPPFLHRTYMIEIIARNSRGDAVTSSLPITVR
jgi:hypothetical protein